MVQYKLDSSFAVGRPASTSSAQHSTQPLQCVMAGLILQVLAGRLTGLLLAVQADQRSSSRLAVLWVM
jgi:hypothetical protein